MKKQKRTPICPWWFCFAFDNFIREWYQKPVKIMTPLVKPGFKVLDVGPGRGYCTFPLASLVQPDGLVVALDIQKKMLDILKKRAVRNGCSNVIAHLYDGKKFGIEQRFDFVNLFWMFHEVGDKDSFLSELQGVCKAGCRVLLAEPYVHVGKKMFDKSVRLFLDNGFRIVDTPRIRISRAAVFEI
ncbi:MAG: class I SAM-dependent methyltransferase [Spirochaetia bacterium]|jgi:ubiquinone/menaquinone biosynthesis C-methylase UbiE|nr:class I SAM-dependent methyltransferase [Spirochaetia bacterium]